MHSNTIYNAIEAIKDGMDFETPTSSITYKDGVFTHTATVQDPEVIRQIIEIETNNHRTEQAAKFKAMTIPELENSLRLLVMMDGNAADLTLLATLNEYESRVTPEEFTTFCNEF